MKNAQTSGGRVTDKARLIGDLLIGGALEEAKHPNVDWEPTETTDDGRGRVWGRVHTETSQRTLSP